MLLSGLIFIKSLYFVVICKHQLSRIGSAEMVRLKLSEALLCVSPESELLHSHSRSVLPLFSLSLSVCIHRLSLLSLKFLSFSFELLSSLFTSLLCDVLLVPQRLFLSLLLLGSPQS